MPRKKKIELELKLELQRRLEEINRVPGPKDPEWDEFLSVLSELNDVIRSSYRSQKSVVYQAYEYAVNECVPAKFREFALGSPVSALVQCASWVEAAKWIQSLRVERTEMRQLIRSARNREGEIIRVQSERHLLLDVKGVPYELDRGGPLSFVLRNKIPVDRLNICPVCDRVYWEKKSGSKTCGERNCSDTFQNWKRKKRGAQDGSL